MIRFDRVFINILQELCGEAYLALRRHSNLLITLFTMMLPAGIAELQSIDNIGYLRQTLAVEKNDEVWSLRQQPTLPISHFFFQGTTGLEQKCTQFLTMSPGTLFHAPSHVEVRFVMING